MRYMLLISADEDDNATRLAPDEVGLFPAWLAELEGRGVLEVHAGLQPSPTATTVQIRGDEMLLTDGPFVLGGLR